MRPQQCFGNNVSSLQYLAEQSCDFSRGTSVVQFSEIFIEGLKGFPTLIIQSKHTKEIHEHLRQLGTKMIRHVA